MTKEEATDRLKEARVGHYEFLSMETLNMAIKALEQTRWIPVSWIPDGRCGYPKPEDEYKHFLTIDNKGEQTVQEFLLSLDEEPQPYFTGMRNIVAWMPLPESYKAENEVEKWKS